MLLFIINFMANIFTDTFDAITGQQITPQQTIIPTSDLISQTGALLPQLAGAEIAYNQALAPGIAGVKLGVANQFDPSLLALQRQGTAATLAQLGMGESLSPELTADIQRKLLETGSATGFGVSPAGIGNVALQTGLEGEARGIARRAEAQRAATTGLGIADSLYQTRSPFGAAPGLTLAGDIRGVQAAQDEMANLKEDIRRQNFSNLLSTGFRIAGGVIGGIYGGAAGAQAGQAAGGGVIQGSSVRGVDRGQASGGGLGGMFSGLFSGGGGGGASQGAMRSAAFEQGGVPVSSYG